MLTADFHRQIARQCRAHLRATRNRDDLVQLETWAVECDRRADHALQRRPSSDMREQALRHEQRAAEYRAVADQMQDPTARGSFRHLAETYEAMGRRLRGRANRKQKVG